MKSFFSRSTNSRTVFAAVALAGALAAGAALAQGYTGPSSSAATQGYSGPSSAAAARQGHAGPGRAAAMTVKELSDQGRDDQNAVLRGRIVSHDGADHYTFEDDTGRIRVEIDAEDFPAGQKIDDKTTVELIGELDRDHNQVEFDVDQIRIL